MTAASWLVVAGVLAGVWLACILAIGTVYRRTWHALWREPVFRVPILVLESDDWGAGPVNQAPALRGLREVLARHRDGSGQPAVMSLALVLAVPDGPAIVHRGQYARRRLDGAEHAPVRAALLDGRAAGVFALQLHGLEHFWPATLMASDEPAVQAWLRQPEPAATEALPSHLQSRWVDARHLPSRSHDEPAVMAACREEAACFHAVTGEPARVVVPPTFVWTDAVERGWAAAGVRHLVTPGVRYVRRGADGGSEDDGRRIASGDRRAGLNCLVRTDYFEPRKGRDAAHALRALARDTACARACVLENHRDNFCGDAALAAHSLAELDRLLDEALRTVPALRLLSTGRLAEIVARRDPAWIETGVRPRLRALWRRLRHTGRCWTLLRWSGAAALGAALLEGRGGTSASLAAPA